MKYSKASFLRREPEHCLPVKSDSSDERHPGSLAVIPDANPEALTVEIYETFSTVSIPPLDLAESLDDKQRHLAMAIYRMSELGLMRVERSLDNEQAIRTI
ncbi:DUF6124 family protein [Pseudomonas sp. IT-P294]|uniref:DUF6124 family protein n=1 Tax=Pseudomonas sp. IT-P294 TaxID=3026454 RepID=UPI0039E06803